MGEGGCVGCIREGCVWDVLGKVDMVANRD